MVQPLKTGTGSAQFKGDAFGVLLFPGEVEVLEVASNVPRLWVRWGCHPRAGIINMMCALDSISMCFRWSF